MAYVPYTPESGCAYTITGPDGTIASFNDKTDANYCGMLSTVTGLDSPDVRESGDVLVQTDGGWHGNFYYGRRPIVMNGSTPNIVDGADRAVKLDRLRRASNAMRQDAIISWLNNAPGSVQMQTWVRLQQPLRITGNWVKDFQLQLVSQFAPLFSTALHTSATAANVVVENRGSWPSYPIITVNGPTTGTVTITNTTTGTVMKFLAGYSTGGSVTVDMLQHTATAGGVSQNQYIDYVNSTWPSIITGNNTFTITGAPNMSIMWRDTWI